ncbi:MAG TPA: helix-turn-helix domain-containing protein [Sphingomonadaceae bacterium]|nr:helix-turn-helix domain-containing protein [Sphingomonadaceae bacterium]
MQGEAISVHYFRLPRSVERYFTAIYVTTVDCGDGEYAVDYLHPDWAGLLFASGTPPAIVGSNGERMAQSKFIVRGATSIATKFAVTRSRIWGMGLEPAGWARFVDDSAERLANRLVDGYCDPAFAPFEGLQSLVESADGDLDSIADRIGDFLETLPAREVPLEDKIVECQEAFRDPAIATVAALRERVDIPGRSLERLCRRYFGFPPKLLIRRQRFLRSLARFMLQSDASWSAVLDGQYHDQSQFVRDFKSFMGLTPRQYAKLPHPVLKPVLLHRLADLEGAHETSLPSILGRRMGRSQGPWPD